MTSSPRFKDRPLIDKRRPSPFGGGPNELVAARHQGARHQESAYPRNRTSTWKGTRK